MNVVDSSGWLEFFADGPNAGFFAPPLEQTEELVVPVITLYEVYKVVRRQRDESDALQAIAQMQQGRVVNLDTSLAVEAGRISLDLGLPMADSIILATARRFGATLYTQDADFRDLPNVRYVARR